MPSDPKTILAADDEPKILDVLSSFLSAKGYRVLTAKNGREALAVFERENIALVLLDLMMPDIPGEEVCRAIRKKSRVPLIMLTAKVEEEDLLRGLAIGADDYITKPFSLKELNARIEALLRRSGSDVSRFSGELSLGGGDLTVDFEKKLVRKKGNDVALTPSELKILSALIKTPGKVFSREDLIEKALGPDFDGYDRAVDVHIKNLRQKIEDDTKNPRYVLTVHGLGYKFGGM
ncbi:MAG: response regulator transcription factor [Fusobacteriaceae bacterium]|jgi:DNA-binding response OmpR family regulator|nr:response regulator transcription factor [Fusobacteriaceae bacterium]